MTFVILTKPLAASGNSTGKWSDCGLTLGGASGSLARLAALPHPGSCPGCGKVPVRKPCLDNHRRSLMARRAERTFLPSEGINCAACTGSGAYYIFDVLVRVDALLVKGVPGIRIQNSPDMER